MSVTKEEYQVIKEIILAHSTYTWCNGHCIPLANTNAVMQSLDNIFADALEIEREPFREHTNTDSESNYVATATTDAEIKKRWWHK